MKHSITIRTIMSVFPLLFLGVFAHAQTVLTGSVKDSDGEAAIGATISLKGLNTGAVCGLDGTYRFQTNASGDVQMMVSFSGYKTITKTVSLSGGTITEDFTLVDDVFSLDQIVVTGTNTARTQKEMAGSLSQLSAKQIQAISANSMADILRVIPGIHAEGGGGDVAANIMVRGMPSGGQYKYTPIEEDGMPVQATGYLTSSAQDVFFRPDMGVANLEFARGGSSTLFGMGSPLGVLNYISKKGGGEDETVVKLTGGQYNLARVDFNTGGSAGENWQYNFSGFARYDEGPVPTGAASRGYQLRGNITRKIDNGYIRFYFRNLNDNAQFYLPFPHVKNTTDAATGNNGEEVGTLYSTQMGVFALVNPHGTVQGNLGNGVTANGNSAMIEFSKGFGNWNVKSKTRLSRFEHNFDFWAPGKTFEMDAYAKSKNPILASHTYTYADNGQPLVRSSGANGGKTYVSENSITLRNRPLTDYSTDLRLTRTIRKGGSEHNLTIGGYGAITRQLQNEYGTGVLVELNDQPRLLDLTLVDTTGKTIKFTKGGFRQNVAGRTYNTFEADRLAIYGGDEMVFGNMRLDVGLRYETQIGTVTVSETAAFTNAAATSSADASYRWQTGKVITRNTKNDDIGFVLGANYALRPTTNLYASFTKGFYFPEMRTFSNVSRDGNGNFIQVVPDKNEALYQFEAGAKYSARNLSGTLALFYNNIQNRLQNDIVAGSDGVLREITTPVGSVTSYGTEITAAYRIMDGLVLDLNTTLQKHQYDDFKKTTSGPDAKLGTGDDVIIDYKGNWILRQPQFLLNGGLTFDKKNWELGLMFNYEGKRFADDQNLVDLPAYALVNLRLGKTFAMQAKQSFKIGLNVYNVANNRGLAEGDPRVADTSVVTNDPFYNARPVLPRRLTVFVMFKF